MKALPRRKVSRTNAALHAMCQALGDDTTLTFLGAFERMDIAENVITASGCTKAQGQVAFGIMCPSAPLNRKCDEVYRAHATELVERVIAGEDTRPGTKAEVLCCLLGAALRAPLNTSGMALADHLFAQVMPGSRLPSTKAREFYQGQVAEDLAQARVRCAVADRIAT